MPEISILIVTWNNKKDIEDCIKSVTGNIDAEIICIDNNSSDGTFEKLKSIRHKNLKIYENKRNVGFTKAVNDAINNSNGKNIFLLNPDTILKDNCIEKLNRFLNNNDEYAACSPKLINEDNSVQYSIRNFPKYLDIFFELSLLSYIFPKSKLFGKWKMKYFDYNTDADVNQPMAAAIMIKKSVLEKIGAMDEQFEMFFNDVDLCKRMIDNNHRIRYINEAEVIHKKGSSVYKNRIRMIKIWNKDCVKYFKKYHNNAFLILWLKISLKVSEIIRILLYKFIRLKS